MTTSEPVDITNPTATVKHGPNSYGLTPWQPGQSGNPKGRPKQAFSITELLRKKVTEDPQPYIDKLVWHALHEGSETSLHYIFDRLDGKPRQTLDASVSDDHRSLWHTMQDALAARMGLMPQLEAGAAAADGEYASLPAAAPAKPTRGRPKGRRDSQPRKPRTNKT